MKYILSANEGSPIWLIEENLQAIKVYSIAKPICSLSQNSGDCSILALAPLVRRHYKGQGIGLMGSA